MKKNILNAAKITIGWFALAFIGIVVYLPVDFFHGWQRTKEFISIFFSDGLLRGLGIFFGLNLIAAIVIFVIQFIIQTIITEED